MIRITDILENAGKYLKKDDLEVIEKAYIFSASVHQGQLRLSGEPYLVHPLEVAGILVSMKLDKYTIVTGLLHDTVEDTLTTIKHIEDSFGKEVAFLVDGLTKISQITFMSQLEQQAENFRKMILAMSSDIRILVVKLADRIHNMRTLEFHPPEKQKFIARETIEIYAPLANRLGINWAKMELEDLSFKYLFPKKYYELTERIAKTKKDRERYTKEVMDIIRKKMQESGLKGRFEGRAKHFYSIYQKMNEQHIDFDEVYDLTAFRIILDSNEIKECYEALSLFHSIWKPVPGRFKDYIAMPKPNNYRSLHTTVIGPYGERVEIQIRTKEMHEWAEKGIASHWRYKEGDKFSAEDESQINKLRELLEVQHDQKDAREFMRNLKLALYPEEIYVFTPKGEVRAFPKGATPVDFAYSIHTDIGNQCVGARVNRAIVPLKYELKNGDTVDIIIKSGSQPSKDWLKHAVTSKAISKIKQWVKAEEREKSVALGRNILEKEFRKHGLSYKKIIKSGELNEVLKENSLVALDDLMALIGYGKMSVRHILNRFLQEGEEKEKEKEKDDAIIDKLREKFKRSSSAGVSIKGIDDIVVRFAKCCSPLPGDDIVGYITRGRGVSVHVATCPKVREMDEERMVDVQWNVDRKRTYPVNIRIYCKDKKGLLNDLSNAMSSMGVNISYANIDTKSMPLENYATCDFQLDIKDLEQLNKLVAELRKIKNVVSVERIKELSYKGEKKSGTFSH